MRPTVLFADDDLVFGSVVEVVMLLKDLVEASQQMLGFLA
jgi:hypothetical protein